MYKDHTIGFQGKKIFRIKLAKIAEKSDHSDCLRKNGKIYQLTIQYTQITIKYATTTK
jgi:hypothetical protein